MENCDILIKNFMMVDGTEVALTGIIIMRLRK